MPTGKRHAGFTYLGLLGLLTLIGAGLAAMGSIWSTSLQRERERELRFRGTEIAQAIADFRDARQPAEWPQNLDELLRDARGGATRHHLRRLYADPFTGAADWQLIPAPDAADRFAGVRSRASQRRLLRSADETDAVLQVSDWQFSALSLSPRATARTP